METKKFHFQEIDWILYFPKYGNKGKYCDYIVMLKDRKKGTAQPRKKIKLGEVLNKAEIDGNFPHTVGFYKVSSKKEASFKPEYLELRKIHNVEDFWLFLNALDI